MLERLKLIRNKLNLERDEFAVLLTYEPKSYQNIENGNEKLGRGLQKKLQKYAKVNLKWFATGEGNMFVETEKRLPDKPPDQISGISLRLTNEQRIDQLILQNSEFMRHNDRLITLLEKQSETINYNAKTIDKLTQCVERVGVVKGKSKIGVADPKNV